MKESSAADFPVGEILDIGKEMYESFQQSWESFASASTIGSIGLCDDDKLMFEYALFSKDGNL